MALVVPPRSKTKARGGSKKREISINICCRCNLEIASASDILYNSTNFCRSIANLIWSFCSLSTQGQGSMAHAPSRRFNHMLCYNCTTTVRLNLDQGIYTIKCPIVKCPFGITIYELNDNICGEENPVIRFPRVRY